MINPTRQQYDWGDGWYPERALTVEPPIATQDEAEDYQTLLGIVTAAGLAVACVEQEPQDS